MVCVLCLEDIMLGREKKENIDWSSLHKFAQQLGDDNYTVHHYTCVDRSSITEKIVIEYGHRSKKND